MALRNQPYIPLYVQDFTTDEKLLECSASATGIYIRIMCVMHKSEEYGTILLNQNDKQNVKQKENFAELFAKKFVKYMPYEYDVILAGLIELLYHGVVYIDGDKLVQKRMVKDNKLSEMRSSVGSIGGKKSAFAKAKTKAKRQANSEYEYENDIEVKDKTKDEKISYSEGVKMKKTEYDSLVAKYGVESTKWMIDKLTNYKLSTGKKYKDDYRAILTWVVSSMEKERKPNSKFNPNIFQA